MREYYSALVQTSLGRKIRIEQNVDVDGNYIELISNQTIDLKSDEARIVAKKLIEAADYVDAMLSNEEGADHG